MLRPYQQEAHDAAIAWMKRSTAPQVIDAATGAGKSHVIAAVADTIHTMTGKRILCLAPSKELVKQNREKFLATGNPCSMFSASAGQKDLRYPVVFGSPLTVKNKISRFRDGYALVIVDEAHGITPTLKSIIEAMREGNPHLRVLGLTATPYRLGSGYIYREDDDGHIWQEDKAKNPYFHKCTYRVDAHFLIDQGYLTPPVIGTVHAGKYDTGGMQTNSRGQFDAADIDRAYHGHGRLTAQIVADVVEQSRDRQGVMFFAATVQHGQEIMASLPPELSAMSTYKTSSAEDEKIVKAFKAKRIKYLVNVAKYTTGFDAPHVDVIAILRKTESVGLLQQIIGRGLRLCEGKSDCLVLDYTTNLEDHCADGDLFDPNIKASKGSEDGSTIPVKCPECGYQNDFTVRGDVAEAGHQWDEFGYVVDLNGRRIYVTVARSDVGEPIEEPWPAHYGRRCWGHDRHAVRCSYRWTGKDCPHCGESNDIAARYCIKCKGEIVDPNEKLKADFKAMKRNPRQRQTDEVLNMVATEGISRAKNPTLKVTFTTPYRTFTVWFSPESNAPKARKKYETFMHAKETGIRTVNYQKQEDGFYAVFAYNVEPDKDPSA